MAKTKEQEQLDVAKSLAPFMERIAASYEKISEASGVQIEAMKQLNDAINSIRTQGVVEQFEQVSESAKKVSKDIEESSKSSQQSISNVTEEAKKSSNFFRRNYAAAIGFAAGAMSGFRQTIKNVLALFRSGFSVIKGFVGSIYNIGKAIISIPFKMLGGLVDIVNNAGGSNELFVAIENIRKEFGALNQTGPSTIFSMAKNLQGFSATGLSSYRIFGNMAQRLEAFLKLAQAMGPTFENFSDEFKKNGGAILAWQKGLGMSDEDMRTLGERAKTMGTDMTSQFLEIQKQTDALGEQFGISTKLIGRDIAKALKDVKHFGGATVKQIATASVYARKLGLELEKVTGILDAFETFEGAAENAAKLSQSFGVQVDAFKMMEAQDPATQIEMLRKQFAAAGQDASKFNRQQLKLLASTTGLDEATARQAFSLKNQGMSLEQIKKQSEKAEKKQLSQAEAMDKLANAIERMAQSGSGPGGGFFDKFLHGIFGGIQASQEFRSIIMNLRMAFRTLITEGVRLGKAIAANPFVKDFLGGIASFFSPGKFRPLIRGVTDELIKLVKGQSSFPEVMKNIREKFLNYFDANSVAGKKVLNGVKGIFKGIAILAAEGIKMAASALKDGVVYITKLLKGEADLPKVEGMGFFGEIMTPLYTALKEAYSVLAPALGELIDVLLEKLSTLFKTVILPKLKEMAPELAMILFGPAFIKGIIGAFAGGLGDKALDTLKGVFAKRLAPGISEGAEKASEASAKLRSAGKGRKGGALTATADEISKLNEKFDSVMEQSKKGSWGIQDAVKMGAKLVALASALALGGVAIAGAIYLISKILGQADKEQITNSILVLVGTLIAMVPMSFASKMLPADGGGGKLLGQLTSLAGALAIGGVAMAISIVAISQILRMVNDKEAKNSILVLAGTMIGAIPMALASKMLPAESGFKKLVGQLLALSVALGVGGIALAGAVFAMSHILGEAKQEQIDNSMILLGGIVLAAVPLMFAAQLASKSGFKGLAGILAMGVAILAIGGVGYLIIEMFNDFGEESYAKMPQIAEFLLKMSLVFLAMVPLLLGAAAIGGILIGSFGTALLAIGAGMAAISVNVLVITAIAKDIMVELDKMTISAGFQAKVDAFVGIMKSIQAFASIIVDLLEVMEPSIIELLNKTTFAEKINSAIELLKEFVGRKGEGKGIIGVVELIMESLKTLNSTPNMEKSAEMLSNLMTGAAGLLDAMKPPDAWFEAMDDFWNQVSGEDEEIVKKLTTYLQGQQQRIASLLGTMKENITKLGGINIPDESKAKGIGAILGAIASIAKNIMPDPKLIQSFRQKVKKTETGQYGISTSDADVIDISQLTTFVESYLKAVQPLFDSLTGGLVNSLLSQVATIDEKRLEKLSSIATIISAIVDLVKSINNVNKDKGAVNVGMITGGFVNITTQVPDIVKIIDGLGAAMGPLMDSIITVVNRMPDSAAFAKRIETVKSLFGVLSLIPQLVAEVSGGGLGPKMRFSAGAAFGFEIYDPIIDAIKIINETLGKLLGGLELYVFLGNLQYLHKILNSDYGVTTRAIKSAETFFGQVEKIVNTFRNLSGLGAGDINIDSIMNNLYKVSQVIESLVTGRGQFDIKSSFFGSKISPIERLKDSLTDKVIKDVESAATRVGKYATHMSTISTAINDGGLKAGMIAITEMVTKAQAMNDALTNLPDLNLDAKLQPLAKGLGLGGKFNYTVASKDVVLKICLNVEMKAADIEEALIMRKDSIIRDRLNFCTETPSSSEGAGKIIPSKRPGVVTKLSKT